VSDHSRDGVEPGCHRRRVAESAREIKDDPTIRAERDIATLGGLQLSQGRLEAEGEELQRNGRAERGYGLGGISDDDESVGARRYQLLTGMGCSAPFYQPSLRVDLVRSVDGNVEPAHGERFDA
jgi:hypothetical protein